MWRVAICSGGYGFAAVAAAAAARVAFILIASGIPHCFLCRGMRGVFCFLLRIWLLRPLWFRSFLLRILGMVYRILYSGCISCRISLMFFHLSLHCRGLLLLGRILCYSLRYSPVHMPVF